MFTSIMGDEPAFGEGAGRFGSCSICEVAPQPNNLLSCDKPSRFPVIGAVAAIFFKLPAIAINAGATHDAAAKS